MRRLWRRRRRRHGHGNRTQKGSHVNRDIDRNDDRLGEEIEEQQKPGGHQQHDQEKHQALQEGVLDVHVRQIESGK